MQLSVSMGKHDSDSAGSEGKTLTTLRSDRLTPHVAARSSTSWLDGTVMKALEVHLDIPGQLLFATGTARRLYSKYLWTQSDFRA